MKKNSVVDDDTKTSSLCCLTAASLPSHEAEQWRRAHGQPESELGGIPHHQTCRLAFSLQTQPLVPMVNEVHQTPTTHRKVPKIHSTNTAVTEPLTDAFSSS